ncbi:hypothetical protein J6590_095766 [Homalodisca vitripennis]|nr:hypothetical protein J6590_096193 [Homalodisca vitripennis]KAG8299642.1 hypothetical protein J6590_095766 [Homalodisca vitripennis]
MLPEYKLYELRNNITTLPELIQAASDYEAIKQAAASYRPPNDPAQAMYPEVAYQRNQQRRVPLPRPQGNYPPTRKKKPRPQESTDRETNGTCWNCGKTALNKRNEILLTRKWKLLGKAGPKQYNTVDCGVFLCITAEACTADRTITFTQSDIPWLRGVIAEELKSGKLQSHQKPTPHIPGVKAPPVKKGRKKIVRSTSPMFVPNPSQTPTDADPPKPELQVIEIKNTEEPSPRKSMMKMEECYMEISSSEDEEEGNNAAATLELCLQEEDRLLTLKDLGEIIDEVATGEPKHQPSNIQEELGTDWDVLSIHDSESLDLKEAEDQVNPQHRATVIQLGKPIEVLGGHTASSDRPTVIQQTSLDAREVTFSGEAGHLDEDTMTITVPNSTQPRDPSSTEKATKKRQRDRKQRTRKVKRLGKGTRKYRDRQTGSKYWKI